MDTFLYHFRGIVKTFEQFFKGKYLLFFIPGLVITIIYYWIEARSSAAEDSLMISSDYSILNWAAGYINAGVKQAFSVFGFIFEQIYIFIVITLLSPFNTLLAERFDSQLTGQKFSANFIRFINDLIRMIFVVFIVVILEFGFIMGYWMISWIIGNETIDTIMYFLISAFFFGFAFYDFSLERYQEGVLASLGFAFSKPLTMLITGSIFLLLYSIPYVGIPLSPVITVMVSTVVYLYLNKKLPVQSTNVSTIENE